MSERSDEQPAPTAGAREMIGVLRRNIRALAEVRRRINAERTTDERVADAISAFVGSMPFAYVHAMAFATWILLNTGVVSFVRPFDPFPFVMLAMIASVEAIFISTFVLITQNRMATLASKRDELDLQVDLLAEHEITRLIQVSEAIARRLGVDLPPETQLADLKKDVIPEEILNEVERAERTDERRR